MLRRAYTFVGYYVTLALFGAAGVYLCVLGFLVGIWPTTARTERFFQRLIHRHFAVFVWWTTRAQLFAVRYHHLDRLRDNPPAVVLAANHPGLTDITSLLALVPEAFCIIKPAIRRNPVLGAAARAAGYLTNDGGHEVVRQAAAKLAAGTTLVIFPEGTRTPPGERVLSLKPGFVLMARRARVPIQLVRIAATRPVLGKDRAWWKLPPLPAAVDIVIGPRLVVNPDANPAEVAAEIEAWFRSEPATAACHEWSAALSLAQVSAAGS